MGTVSRVRVIWGGAPVVGGGVSTFYTVGSPTTLAAAVNTWCGVLKGVLPATTSLRVDDGGETFDESTGAPVGTWSGGSFTPWLSATAGVYAQGVGMRVQWNTAGVTGRRRVKGSTYIVPLVGVYYSSDGTIDDTWLGTLQTASNALRTAAGAGFGVWSRPTPLRDPVTGDVIPPPPYKYGGIMHDITSVTIPDKVSWLRSRRT